MQPMVRSACLTSSRTVPKSFEVAEMKTLTGASGSFASLLRVAMGEDERQFYFSQSLCGSFLSVHRTVGDHRGDVLIPNQISGAQLPADWAGGVRGPKPGHLNNR